MAVKRAGMVTFELCLFCGVIVLVSAAGVVKITAIIMRPVNQSPKNTETRLRAVEKRTVSNDIKITALTDHAAGQMVTLHGLVDQSLEIIRRQDKLIKKQDRLIEQYIKKKSIPQLKPADPTLL